MVMWYGTKANIAPCGLSHSSIYQTQTIISDLFNFQGDIFLKIFQKEQKGFFFIGNIQLSVLSIFVQLSLYTSSSATCSLSCFPSPETVRGGMIKYSSIRWQQMAVKAQKKRVNLSR